MKKIFAMLLVVTVFGVVLGGCSKDPAAEETTGGTTTAGTAGTTGETGTTTGS